MNCSQQCVGHCRDNATCDHVTGGCDTGCDAAWTGYMCDKGDQSICFFPFENHVQVTITYNNTTSFRNVILFTQISTNNDIFKLCVSNRSLDDIIHNCFLKLIQNTPGKEVEFVITFRMLKCELTIKHRYIIQYQKYNICVTIVYIYAHLDCDNGTYDTDCINRCSGHCLNNYPCNKQTGHCERGCYPGYTNSNCSKGTCLRSP